MGLKSQGHLQKSHPPFATNTLPKQGYCVVFFSTSHVRMLSVKQMQESMLRLSFLSLVCVAKVGWSIIIHVSSPYNASQPLEGRNATARRHVSCYAKWDSTGEKLFTMATSGHCLEHANVCHYTMPVISLCFCLCIGSYIC